MVPPCFVYAPDLSEKWHPLFGLMLEQARVQTERRLLLSPIKNNQFSCTESIPIKRRLI
jgi:hypothetical protein